MSDGSDGVTNISTVCWGFTGIGKSIISKPWKDICESGSHFDKTHNPFGEIYWVSCLRENFTSSSNGEGLETDRKQAPRQSFTRQVFFKVVKSHLALAKEFQGRSYDMMLAHTTIVFMRYIMLAVESRNSTDPRTIGDLFYYMCDETEDIKFSTSIMLIIDILKKILSENPIISEDLARQIIDTFISSLPKVWMQKLKLSA